MTYSPDFPVHISEDCPHPGLAGSTRIPVDPRDTDVGAVDPLFTPFLDGVELVFVYDGHLQETADDG